MPRVSTEPVVMKYLKGVEDGDVFSIENVVAGTGLSENQVRSVIYRVLEKGSMNISVVTRGHLWRMNNKQAKPPTEPVKKVGALFVCVGAKMDGTKLVQDENGKLYELKEI